MAVFPFEIDVQVFRKMVTKGFYSIEDFLERAFYLNLFKIYLNYTNGTINLYICMSKVGKRMVLCVF